MSAQVIHPDDLPRLSRMNFIASMQPPHGFEDKTWADLTVMDIDPFSLEKSETHKLLGGKIEMTIVAGKVVHDVDE
jgi:predicted amidohydrolase YtcJ